jgi:hypothetical protein
MTGFEPTGLALDVVFASAGKLLDTYAAQAALEQNVTADFETQKNLRDTAAAILSRMQNAEGYPNPRYNGLAEALARALVLYASEPQRYMQMMQGICDDEMQGFLESYEGLLRLETFASAISDDHEYVFNGRTATIEHSSVTNAHAVWLTPSRFLVLVKALEAGHTTQDLVDEQ